MTHSEDGSTALKVDPNDPTSADRGPYELRIRAQDSWGAYNDLTDYPSDPDPEGWQRIDVTVLNRDTGIHASTIDDSPVTEDVERTFNIDAYDEEVENGTVVVTEYVLEVWADPDGSGPEAEQYISYTDYNLLTLDPTSPYYGRAQATFVSEGADAGDFSWMPNDLDAVAGHLDFRVYHDDGNLSVPYEDFTLTVTNEPPAFTPGTNDTKLLIEDSTNSAYYEIDINTDDESEGGVDYWVWFQVSDGTAPDASSTGWIEITGSGYVPNALINGNGTITFDQNTGVITWHTTNADVNYAEDGVTVIDDNHHYWIKVEATDTLGGTTDTVEDPPAIFEVRVQNVKTEIDQVEYTDLNGDTQVQAIAVDQDPATPIVLTPAEAEDTPFYLDFGATDEEHESGAYTHDSYYVIHVTGPSGIDYTFSPSNADPYTPFEAGSGLLTGGTMTYNKDTGIIQWDPNNRDVGTWYFEVTHYDDRGTSDTVTIQVEVANNAPEWIAAPTEWHLVEDDDIYPGPPDDWTLDDALVKADDEGLGQTYSLTIDGQAFDTSWTGVVVDGDWLKGAVNGSEGGILEFNTLTGEIVWRTTNADVTGAVGSSKPPYTFVLTATDSHGDSTSSPAFLVSVDNEPTVIDSVVRIDGDPDDGYAKEKVAAVFDPHATDEGTDRAASAGRDGVTTYYTLQVDDGTGAVDWQWYNANNGARGDVDYFNTATGEFSWTPDNLDTGKTYTFILTHHDDNGGQDSENVVLTVLNTDPYFTAFPTQWTLHEDDTNPADYTLDQAEIQTDQEGLALRYTLHIDGVEWTPGYAPNASDGGGVIQYFDTVTGEIQWSTTNAHVTIDQDGTRNRPAYEFRIMANDQHGGVIEQTFAVDVTNDPTSINDIPDQHVVEDEIVLEIGNNEVTARDEGVGGGFYTLEVQRLNSDGSVTAFVTVDAYNAANAAGADIAFDSQTGAIHWETTNRDVGDYVFRITHDDTHGSTATDTFAVQVENTAPVFTTAAPGPNFQLPPTFSMTYDPLTSDEGQHDCRRDDRVIYSLVEAPPGMTIDPLTGFVSWTAPPSLAGKTMEVIIRVDDGNGGVAFQRFTVEVLNPVKDMPWEMRAPESDFRTTDQGERPEPGLPFQGHDIRRSSLPSEPSLDHLPREFFEEALKAESGLEELLKRLAKGIRLEQPSLEPSGITDLPTGLYGFLQEGLKGRRLDFNLDEIQAWTDLIQPSLPHGGSQGPETPLEGYAPQVEAGSRLNFDFFPIKEALAIKLDDLKAADLLGL